VHRVIDVGSEYDRGRTAAEPDAFPVIIPLRQLQNDFEKFIRRRSFQ
jgi:hypothetical protein